MKDEPPSAWAGELKKDSGSYLTLSYKAVVNDFAQDLPLAQAHLLAATQGPWFAGALDDKLSIAAWHTKPSWYVVADQDRMIDSRGKKDRRHDNACQFKSRCNAESSEDSCGRDHRGGKQHPVTQTQLVMPADSGHDIMEKA